MEPSSNKSFLVFSFSIIASSFPNSRYWTKTHVLWLQAEPLFLLAVIGACEIVQLSWKVIAEHRIRTQIDAGQFHTTTVHKLLYNHLFYVDGWFEFEPETFIKMNVSAL